MKFRRIQLALRGLHIGSSNFNLYLVKMRKILFIHHGTAFGGAPLSLLYTALGLQKTGSFQAVVALVYPSDELRKLYGANGIETIDAPDINIWHHSTVAYQPIYSPHTWKHLANVFWNWKKTKKATLKLVEQAKADIVHLNSMPLSASAEALIENKIRFVWHVREPAKPSFGIRYKIIQRLLVKANALIFISNADKKSWLKRASQRGNVIHNFIDFNTFNGSIYPITSVGSTSLLNRRVILYVGGNNPVKGVFVLLEAIKRLSRVYPDLLVLMPGSKTEIKKNKNLVEILKKDILRNDNNYNVERRIKSLAIENNILQLPFDPDITKLFSSSEFLVFPSIYPHFARPIIEANAMSKPVIASKVAGMQELVIENETGYLVKPRDVDDLVQKCCYLLENRNLAVSMGAKGQKRAKENFSQESQINKIIKVYDTVFEADQQ